MAYDPKKVPESLSDGVISFANSGGKIESTYQVGSDYLNYFIQDLLGFSRYYANETSVISSGIYRKTPSAHPQFPWLYVDGVTKIEGNQYVDTVDGEFTQLTAGKYYDAPPLIPVYKRSSLYNVNTSFSPVPYRVASNEWVTAQKFTVNYYVPGDTAAAPIAITNLIPEWYRYTTLTVQPKGEFISADVGAQIFYDTNGTYNNQPSTGGQTKILFPSTKVVFKWSYVPYVFVTGRPTGNAKSNMQTCFDKFVGQINQKTFYGYAPGTLLYEGINVTDINPVAFPIAYADGVLADKYTFEQNFTCTVEIECTYRNPTPGCTYTVSSGNQIRAGHNLVPRSSNGKWYCAVNHNSWTGTAPSTTSTTPLLYQSFPFEFLFTDPCWLLPALP